MKNKIKSVVAFLVVAVLACTVFIIGKTRAYAYDFTGSAQSMIVLERNSGRVLKQKNADKRLPMASTTKIATAITVIENTDDLERVVEVPTEAQGVEGSSIYLKAGEKIRIIDLLYGLMLQSGNDCAVALAIVTKGSVEDFAFLMNETAKKVGATNTNFVNPHGLHDDNHYTTARDLAKITAHAMSNEIFAKIVSTKKYIAPWDGKDHGRVILNKNKILSTYDGGDGVKTGYTKKAGRCLVASSTKEDMSVIAVVLNCAPMFEDCRKLMDQAYDEYDMVEINSLIDENESVSVEKGKKETVRVGVNKLEQYPLTNAEKEKLRYEINCNKILKAPISECEEIGKIEFFIENELLFVKKLYTIERVESLSVRDSLGEIIKDWNK